MARVPPRLTALPGFADDVASLPSAALQKMVFTKLVDIRDGVIRGQALDARVTTGDLGDCYKLYFDTDGSQKPRYRLVYRIINGELNAVTIEAVAVGRRANLEAYRLAADRLGRSE